MNTERIVVVTGASRGAGKGVALALGTPGTTVYVTGRTVEEGAAPLPGTVGQTAQEINDRGGTGIAVQVDHTDDAQVKALFDRVAADHGRLDILVNNALAIPDQLAEKGPFWEKPLDFQMLLDVGMRSNYVASWYAAPLLLKSERGLLVTTSSPGGRNYMHGPAYGAGKAANDKMMHDMAIDLKPFNVAALSLWMGLLRTERTARLFTEDGSNRYSDLVNMSESQEFNGRVIDALYNDPKLMERTGQVVYGAEIAEELGVVDIDGRTPSSPRAFMGDTTVFGSVVIE